MVNFMDEFIFVRHGQSQANADKIIADANSPLTSLGYEQAKATGINLKGEGVTQIVCSPFLRARQTAKTIAGEIGIDPDKIKVVDELRERGLGVLEGTKRDHASEWYYLTDEPDGIELTTTLYNRMSKCLKILKKMSEKGSLLAVGHGCSGFYLRQIAAKKASVKDFDTVSLMDNAVFIKIKA
jgi:broad specificity phosphatase PhoE